MYGLFICGELLQIIADKIKDNLYTYLLVAVCALLDMISNCLGIGLNMYCRDGRDQTSVIDHDAD